MLDLISRNMLDLKSLEERDVSHIFLDKKVQSQLVQAFLLARGDDCLWYARLLKTLYVKELDAHIINSIKDQDEKTQIGLLELLSPHAGKAAVQILKELADPKKPDMLVAILKIASRLDTEFSSDFDTEILVTSKHPEVKACAVISFFEKDPDKYREIINACLDEGDIAGRKAGVIAAGESGEDAYIKRLERMLSAEENDPILPFVLKSLHRLGTPDMNTLAYPYLSHSLGSVRMAALEAFEIENDDTMMEVINMMNDPSDRVHDLAKLKIEDASYQNAQLLVESLTIPRSKVREGIFHLLQSMDIKNLDVFRAARFQLERSYRNIAEAEAIRVLPKSRERDLLLDHLDQKRMVRLENALRILVTQDRSGRMRTIWRGVSSTNSRQRSNSLEALDDLLDSSLSGIMIPLLEDLPLSQCLAIGRKKFQLPNFDSNPAAIYNHLLEKQNWVTVVLTLYMIDQQDVDGLDKGFVRT